MIMNYVPYFPEQSTLLAINVCGRAHRGPVYGFLVFWLQIAIEPFALFHHNVFCL